jgi:EAL domain-containing protein (putative c-di-GMP-specific phosphodiesterase class I)
MHTLNSSIPAQRSRTAAPAAIAPARPHPLPSPHAVQQMVDLVRDHLDMDIAFVAEFVDGERVLRWVSAAGDDAGFKPGRRDPMEATYCHGIAAGTVDPMVPNTAIEPGAQRAASATFGAGARIGATIRLESGHVYGTLCAFRRTPDHTLRERDLKFVRFMAALVAERLDADHSREIAQAALRGRLRDVMAAGDPGIVYQPIAALDSGMVVGYEALARFHSEPVRTPDVWFAEAKDAGLQEDLECRAIARALRSQHRLGTQYLSINVSPAIVASPHLDALLEQVDCARIVLEITEHDADPAPLRPMLDAIRGRGIRIALDDVGAGYAGLNRLLAIAPDVIKLDRDITRGVADDAARQALVAAAMAFTNSIGAVLIAEGIETALDLQMLRERGVKYGQGYFVGRPGPMR